MKRLIECVPNFSEGRDPAKVDAIVASMSAVAGVYVLDREMDTDHHRCVVTLAGDPEAVAEAALRGVGKAMELKSGLVTEFQSFFMKRRRLAPIA